MRKAVLLILGLVVAVIVTLGLVVLSSAGQAYGLRYNHDAFYYFKHQLCYVALGIPLAYLISKFDYHHLRNLPVLTYAAYALVIILLAVVFLFPAVKGSHRWIKLGPVNLQPSEIAKLMSVIIVALWADRLKWQIEKFWKGAIVPMLFIAALAGLVITEPDFGSTMVIVLSGFLVLFIAGTKIWQLFAMFLAGALCFIIMVINNPNRMARMAAFTGKDIDLGTNMTAKAIDNAAYQGHHALVSLHNGGIWGVGLNESMQKQSYLPEMHTDMIFAIGAEELGLVFSLGLVILWVIFFALTLNIAKHSPDRFGRLIVFGMSFILCFQTFFNIGVVCGALPMKGMALPFFTYGGTNILCAFAAVGMILSVGRSAYYESKGRRKRG